MKRRTNVLIVCLFISLNLFAQDYKTRFIFEPLTVSEIRQHESEFNSTNLGLVQTKVSEDFFEGAIADKDYYPQCFQWTNDDFYPSCMVDYYLFTEDSVAKVIVYDWNLMDYVKNLKTEKELILAQPARKKEYQDKYNAIYKIVSEKFGKPTSEEKIRKKGEGYIGSSTWVTDNQTIELFFTFTTELKTLGEFVFGTFRVRMKVQSK